ncbi:hypothetical protein [Moraxella sp. Pampa]|uniref:hypothetical protein n=1 Tax=Moraxella sp. Pampa TaxID=3111978 RepID=UPI002B40C537|nr:hypothetical protein [Moraxella sp. Pampa]
MPKVTTSPKSRTQIQADSDAKRGIKIKAFKLHLDDIAMIEQVAERLGLPQNQLIVEAVKAYEKGLK